MPQLDKYRIKALVKILNQGCLSTDQHAAALETLIRKCAIFADGCHKRGHIEKAEYYRNLPDTILNRYHGTDIPTP
jgi:hypothetical protein